MARDEEIWWEKGETADSVCWGIGLEYDGFAIELYLLRRRVVLQPKIALDLPKVEIGIFCLHPLRICWEYDPQFLPANIKGGEEMTFILQLKPMTMMRDIRELTICST